MRAHQPYHSQAVCSCLKNLYSPPVYIRDAASAKPQEIGKRIEPGLKPIILIHQWIVLYTITVCVLCIVVDFVCLVRRSVLSASLPFLSVTTLTIPLCSALFFFLLLSFPPPLLGLFCRLPPLFVSGCALTAIKRLPFMRNRSKDKDKAKAIYRRSMCKIAVSRHANLPLSPLPPIVSVRRQSTGKVTHFSSLTVWDWQELFQVSVTAFKLRLKSFFWNYQMSKYFWLISAHLQIVKWVVESAPSCCNRWHQWPLPVFF